MLPVLLDQFDIEVDTDNPYDISLAVAARGVLQAAGHEVLDDQQRWNDALIHAIQQEGLTPWRLPDLSPSGGGSRRTSYSASDLAQAWKDAITSTEGARLAIEPSATEHWATLLPTVRSLSQRFVAHPELKFGGDSGISSIVLSQSLSAERLGSWPVRIGVFPSEDARELAAKLRAASMFRRDMAKVTVLGREDAECDVLLAPFPLSELRGRMASMGLQLKAGIIAAPRGGFRNRTQTTQALSYMKAELEAGVIVTGVPAGGFEALWTNELVRALSHRAPVDIALWEADAMVRHHVGPSASTHLRTPTIVADPGFLAESPLDRHVVDLAARLEELRDVGTIHVSSDAASRLWLPEGKQPVDDVANALRSNLRDYPFLREDDQATGVSDLSQTVSAVELAKADTPSVGTKPEKRRPELFADVTFSEAATQRRIDDIHEALQQHSHYLLEVALRRVPNGISHRGGAARPVAPIPPGKDVSLLVVVSAQDEDFEIAETVQTLNLPAELGSDSTLNAVFRVRPMRHTPDTARLASIEVRIYFEFNLIEYLEVKAEVVLPNSLGTTPRLDLPTPIFIEQGERIGRSYSDVIEGLQPRKMSVDVRSINDVIRFTFLLKAGEGVTARSMVMHARSDVSLVDLTRALNRARRMWEEIAIDRFGHAQQVTEPVFNDTMHTLAKAGRDLWSLLFRGTQGTSIWIIGEWLRKHPVATGSLIEIQLLDGARAFVFPWSLLYDRKVSRGDPRAVDTDGFWGLRYCIEQRLPSWLHRNDGPLTPPLGGAKLSFMVWAPFPNSKDQQTLLRQLAAESQGKLVVSLPAIDDDETFYAMVEKCDADILYFYTHGHTRPQAADSGYSEVRRIRERYEALADAEKQTSGLRPLYELISAPDFEPDESWVALTYGRLVLRDMRAEPVNLLRAPIVFLNMCQSAQLMPGLSESFVNFFLERNARSVLGTECPITTSFAHPFSERLLRDFLGGQHLGEALRRTRCHFMQQRNPLGLAYSLFGSATVRYDPPIISVATSGAA